MNRKNIVLHPILFAIFPVLSLYAHNISQLSSDLIIKPLFLVLSIALLSWFLLTLILKDIQKAGLIVSLFFFLFFSYGHLYKAVRHIGLLITIRSVSVKFNPGLLSLLAILFIAESAIIIKVRKELHNLTRFLNIVAVALIATSVITVAAYKINTWKIWTGKYAGDTKVISSLAGDKELPNIYHIILDAYAGPDILKDLYGYDNSEFLDWLREKGFYVADKSTSNYCQTVLTLASAYNFTYLDDVAKSVGITAQDHEPLRSMVKSSSLFRLLKGRGYDIVAFYSGQIETEIDNADIYIKSGQVLDTFTNELINTSAIPAILEMVKLRDQFDIHMEKLLYIFDHLADTCKLKPPVFVFAHIEAPHPPFVFGRNGEKVKFTKKLTDLDGDHLIRKGGPTRAQYRKAYIDQLIFINKKIKLAIDNIISSSDRPPIIILQADHGPRSMMRWQEPEKTDVKECFSILNALYLPDRDYNQLHSSIGPANTFITVVNKYFDMDYELLDEKNYFTRAFLPYDYMDVTDRVKR